MNLDLKLDYELALARIVSDLSERQKELLLELYRAPDTGVAAGLLAPVLGLTHHAPLNRTIASIGKALAAAVHVDGCCECLANARNRSIEGSVVSEPKDWRKQPCCYASIRCPI